MILTWHQIGKGMTTRKFKIRTRTSLTMVFVLDRVYTKGHKGPLCKDLHRYDPFPYKILILSMLVSWKVFKVWLTTRMFVTSSYITLCEM